MKSALRLVLALLTSVIAVSAALLVSATPAHAADYYRYWSYFHVEGGTYVASDKGFGAFRPADGSIEAYRFAASGEASPNLPRVDLATATFDAICGGEEVEAGQKRVAVILDYGVDDDAEGQAVPGAEAECAEVPTDATGRQVLQAVEDVRAEASSFGPLLCAIDGYPAKGCADQTTSTPTPADSGFVPVELDNAATETPSATSSPTDLASPSDLPEGPGQNNDQDTEQGRGANPFAYVGLGVAVFAIIGGGIYLARRSRRG